MVEEQWAQRYGQETGALTCCETSFLEARGSSVGRNLDRNTNLTGPRFSRLELRADDLGPSSQGGTGSDDLLAVLAVHHAFIGGNHATASLASVDRQGADASSLDGPLVIRPRRRRAGLDHAGRSKVARLECK